MKIEKISDNKIKVELDASEIKKWNRVANKPIPNYNEIMWDLIGEVEKETGVSFHNCQVVVEAIQKDENTFVLYVTKTGHKPSVRLMREHGFSFHKQPPVSQTGLVYEFHSLDDVCEFASHYPVFSMMLSGNNSLYKYENAFYLDLSFPAHFKEYQSSFQGSVSEYARLVKGSVIPYRLQEHGTLLIEKDALKKIRLLSVL